MGSASCKNSKPPPATQQKIDNKNITIGVFGLDDAGKTSTVKAIEGEPITKAIPTISSISTMVTNPLNEKTGRIDKNKNQQNIRIIDVSGERKFRQQSWPQYYDQIHGLIFVMDASKKKRFNENQETLENLLENDKLKNKPILILANKQDQKSAINNEHDLKRQLDIENLKRKYKIELCTALPQNQKNKVDESIRKGFSWLIRTIDENYTELNSRVIKTNTTRTTKKSNRSESDENDSDHKYSKQKTTDYRSKITSEKLPSISANKNKTKLYSDDDDDDDKYPSSINDFNKKKKVLGGITNNNKPIKKSGDNEPKAFRSTYESFPDDTPWSPSTPTLKTTRSDGTLPKLNTKSLVTIDPKRRGVSPLVHDTKSYTNGSLSKRDNDSEDDDYFNTEHKPTNRFDNSSFSTNRFSSNIKKTTSSIYDDDDNDINSRRINTTSSLSKKETRPKYDDEGYPTSKPGTRSTYNNDYSTSKTTNRSRFNHDDDDDDDDHHWSSSKPTAGSKYDHEDRSFSSSKPISRSKFEDDDYSKSKPPISSSKSINHSKYDDDDDDDYPTPSSKTVARSKYDDDDDDDDDHYHSSSKKTSYPSSYGTGVSRSRFENDDFFTTKMDQIIPVDLKKTLIMTVKIHFW